MRVFFLFLVLVVLPLPAEASGRIALVIGNGRYASAPLKNPVNDARDMAAKLGALGFSVSLLTDADQREMERAIRKFGDHLSSADMRLFYYAGHGMQIQGANYLVPIGADVRDEDDVKYESVDAGRVLDKMRRADGGVNVMILDACRNNPFARSFRSADRGLKRMDAPLGTIVVYSTSPDSVAADGDGRNGIFTQYLLKYLTRRDLALQDVMRLVRKDVVNATGRRQIPWASSSLMDEVFLGTGTRVADGSPRPPVSSPGYASLKIESEPSGADVFVDGTRRGRTPLNLTGLRPGRIRVRLTKSGFERVDRSVSVSAGETAYLPMVLNAGPRSRLTVRPDPSNARVRILNVTAVYHDGIVLAPGRYQVEVSRQGYDTFNRWVTLSSGQNLVMPVSLRRHTTVATSRPSPSDSAAGFTSGGSSSPPTVLTLRFPPGAERRKPKVRFTHANHEKRVGQCTACHHTARGRGAIGSCSARGCHDDLSRTSKRDPRGYYQAFHNKRSLHSCLGCHKAKRQGPKGCRECHPK